MTNRLIKKAARWHWVEIFLSNCFFRDQEWQSVSEPEGMEEICRLLLNEDGLPQLQRSGASSSTGTRPSAEKGDIFYQVRTTQSEVWDRNLNLFLPLPRSQSAARCCFKKRRVSITESVVSLPCSYLYWAALLNIQSLTGLNRYYREAAAAYPALPPRGNIRNQQPLIESCNPCEPAPKRFTQRVSEDGIKLVVCEFAQMNQGTHTTCLLVWEGPTCAEGRQNPQFTQVTRALEQNFCRLPEYLRCSSHQ